MKRILLAAMVVSPLVTAGLPGQLQSIRSGFSGLGGHASSANIQGFFSATGFSEVLCFSASGENRHGLGWESYSAVGINLSVNFGFSGVEEDASVVVSSLITFDDGSSTNTIPSEANLSFTGPVSRFDFSEQMFLTDAVVMPQPGSVTVNFLSAVQTESFTVLNLLDDNYKDYANDGIDDFWQFFHFGDNQPIGFASANPDHDNFTNLEEFAYGLVPNFADLNPPGTPRFVWIEDSSLSYGALSFDQVPDSLNGPVLHYLVEVSDDLENWSPLTIEATALLQPNGYTRRTIRDNVSRTSNSKRFYRIRLVAIANQ